MTTTPEPDSRRVAVVTGGAGAIGSAITDALQGNGHRTVVLDRIGEVVCDLSSEASTRTAGAAVLERFGAAMCSSTDEQFDATVERQALRRRLTPEDTAAAVAFLASDGAAAMTGQVLCADGGLVLR